MPPQTPIEGVPVIFMNWFRTIGSPGELALDVGYQAANMPPQPAVHLVLTWEHAKLLSDALANIIDGIEAQIGEVRDLTQYMTAGPVRFGPGSPQDGEE
jgi:hypothetical protein